MDEAPHIIEKIYLAGGVVQNGLLSDSDVAHLRNASAALAALGIPMSVPLASAATSGREKVSALPYRYANLNDVRSDGDYLKTPAMELDLLVLCAIREEKTDYDGETTDPEIWRLQRDFAATQAGVNTMDSLRVSDIHTERSWAGKIDRDRPYVVFFAGGPDTLHPDPLRTDNYVRLGQAPMLTHHAQGVLIDKYYLQDLAYPLLEKWAADKKNMPPLIPVINAMNDDPKVRSFDWDSYRGKYVPSRDTRGWAGPRGFFLSP